MTQVTDRINKAREIMEKSGISVYVVVTGDYHISEYSGDYFKEREYITGFTGSAGTFVLSGNEASLFVDGRYYVQADIQTAESGIKVMKMGMEGVPAIADYIAESVSEGQVVGFDARTVSARFGITIENAVKKKGATCDYSFNAVEQFIENRADFPHSRAYYLDEKYSGESIMDKLKRVREELRNNDANGHVTATLDDVCWLYNIRGNDVEFNPVIMAYSYITLENAYLYTDVDRFDRDVLEKFENAGVTIKEYESIYDDMRKCSDDILVDEERANFRLIKTIMNRENGRTIKAINPETMLKAVKNETEIRNLKEVHVDDGVALTKFIIWLKDKMQECAELANGKEDAAAHSDKVKSDDILTDDTLTEYAAAQYLDSLREKIDDYIEPSFSTISAYNANAAQMHYSADKETGSTIEPHGMLLVDSGGQYLRGTTDVTRTIAVGAVTDAMKKHYTLTLKGMLNLTAAKFLKGCTGFNLDILARAVLWEEGIDYRCGTGHGIGYLLNVHESPNGIRWKHNIGVNDLAEFEEGMVTSNEPGVYIEGEYGIRIENEILCVRDCVNEYGTFLRFETLTMVPVDLELVDVRYLDEKDLNRLNFYHKMVYEKLSPHFEGDELAKLKYYTREVKAGE